jgi:hypothetical protein
MALAGFSIAYFLGAYMSDGPCFIVRRTVRPTRSEAVHVLKDRLFATFIGCSFALFALALAREISEALHDGRLARNSHAPKALLEIPD